MSLGERAAALRVEEALFGTSGQVVSFDRYEVIALVGRGAFGSVYRCRDPKLGREVALKIFQSGDQELIREAKTMATVAHPNIAAIYDAGVVGQGKQGRVFIAMELIVGMPLRQWMVAEHAKADRLAILLQAGRGLSAAHAHGIVHSDFKPDNILVGDDGRVRVVDFGLSSGDAVTDNSARSEESQNPITAESSDQTTTHTAAGTPAYMAAEQHAGQPATTESDQFSFCVTAWEVLYGKRPFPANTVAALITAQRENRPQTNEQGGDTTLRLALERGLDSDPNKRHASLDALLAHLVTKTPPRRRLLLVALGALSLAILAGVFWARSDTKVLCQPDKAGLQKVWNDEVSEQARAAFDSSARKTGAETWQRTRTLVDDYSREWLSARARACQATHVHKEQTVPTLERRMMCFDRHLADLAALVHVFVTVDAAVVDRAIAAAHDLPALGLCGDSTYLQAQAPATSPEAQAVADELYAELATAIALHRTGKGTEALGVAKEVQAHAAAVQHQAMQASAAIWVAEASLQLAQAKVAMDTARQAFDLALEAGDDRMAVHAASILAFQGAHDPSKKAESLRWTDTGMSLLARIHDDPAYAAKLANAAGNSHLTAGESALARPFFEEAVAAFARIDPDHPNIGSSTAMIGISYLQEGQLKAARAKLSEASERIERTLGKDHPELASTLVNLSLVDTAVGDYAASELLLRRAAAVQVAAFGESYALLVYTHLNLGIVLLRQGKLGPAKESLETALDNVSKTYGPTHPLTAQVMVALSEVLAHMGEGEESIRLATTSLQTLRAAFGGETSGVAMAYAGLALAHRRAGDAASALEAAQKGVALTTEFGPSDPRHVLQAYQEAEALNAIGRLGEALERFGKLDAQMAPNSDPRARSLIRFGVARSMPVAEREAAVKIANQALAAFPASGDAIERNAIKAWLARAP